MGAILVTWGHACQLPKSLRPWTLQAGATLRGISSRRRGLYQCVCETPGCSGVSVSCMKSCCARTAGQVLHKAPEPHTCLT